MKRKLLILAAALGLVVGLAPAATAAPGQYAYDCDMGVPNNSHYYADHLAGLTPTTEVDAFVSVRDLRPCTNPDDPAKIGASMVLISLQQSAGPTDGMVQLGYGEIDCTASPPCIIPDDGNPHFIWTPNDAVDPGNPNSCVVLMAGSYTPGQA